jgi:glutamate N-acetyltransferase/amino-acid N-acetyltransferase
VTALPPGFAAAGIHCGIKSSRTKLDLGLLAAAAPRPAAAVFTRNLLLGAHVTVSREQLARSKGMVRAVLVNSGNANCATGAAGIADAHRIIRHTAELLGCAPEHVLFWSTGVIGARLPVDTIADGLPSLVSSLHEDGADDFARAIMTTDTRPKVHTARSGAARITGIAKGAGMVHPDMATMLGFLLTDALVPDPAAALRDVAARTFHCLSIDGDTSPNDAVLLWSSGAVDSAGALPELRAAGRSLCRAIAADGEGASRLVTIVVRGAPDEGAAARVGRAIATSPLVKTAIFGRDPNWGRIVAAAGRSGVALVTERMRLAIGGAVVFSEGRPHPAAEASAHRHLAESEEVLLELDLALGAGSAECWTCDLTPGYVEINASYRS